MAIINTKYQPIPIRLPAGTQCIKISAFKEQEELAYKYIGAVSGDVLLIEIEEEDDADK